MIQLIDYTLWKLIVLIPFIIVGCLILTAMFEIKVVTVKKEKRDWTIIYHSNSR